MKIIVINPKKDFTEDYINKMGELGTVEFIETADAYKDYDFSKDAEEKVIALGPDVVAWSFPNEVIDRIQNLNAICLPTTGFAFVDGTYLKSKGIILTNVPKYSTESVAEYAISLMLNITKRIPLVIKNNWKIDYNKHQGFEIKGKTMGVIGLGAIGTRIAELGQQIGMKVVYWSRKSRDKKFEYKELNEVLSDSDYIFPALAKNADTHKMIDKKKIDLMKPNSFIVSITGEDIFDFEYAAEKVREDKLAGVALESEEKTVDNYEGNIWVTPPIAWFTKEAFDEDMRIWVNTICAVAKGKPINCVN